MVNSEYFLWNWSTNGCCQHPSIAFVAAKPFPGLLYRKMLFSIRIIQLIQLLPRQACSITNLMVSAAVSVLIHPEAG